MKEILEKRIRSDGTKDVKANLQTLGHWKQRGALKVEKNGENWGQKLS